MGDSAINSGSSGGPAFNSKGQVTGVAFKKKVSSKSQKVDNIGYLIPAVIVLAFLDRFDAENEKYTLAGTIPYSCHSLENQSLRKYHKVPDSIHGVLITSVATDLISDKQLQPGDILTKIDDSEVADDGQVVLRGDELIQHAYLMVIKKKDEAVIFTIYRNSKQIQCDPYYLNYIPKITPLWKNVNYMPNYVIIGSLNFLPLFIGMKDLDSCNPLLKSCCLDHYWRWPKEWEGKECLVVLTEIFAHELTFSYIRPWRRVLSYNGIQIKSLIHLQHLWNESCERVLSNNIKIEKEENKKEIEEENTNSDNSLSFVRLELEHDDDIVLEVESAMKAQKEVMATHAIPQAYNIVPKNPKYVE